MARDPDRSAPLPLALVGALLFLGCAGEREDGGASAPARGPGAVATAVPRAARPTPHGDAPLVVFLGDSLSAGLHVDAQDAFPALLRDRLAGSETPFRLVNAGVSGDTTAGGLRRLDWLLAQEPAGVVVELGGNDGLRGVPLDAIEANLRAIVEEVRAAGAAVLLLGMKLPPNYGPDYTAGFEAVYARVAEELDVPLDPFFLAGVGGVRELNFEDGIHPNERGHRAIAERLEPILARWLARLEP